MIPKWVGKYIGLPFEEYNCWQLMCLIYRNEFDIELPDFKGEYSNALDAKKIEAIYNRELLSRFTKIDVQKQFCFVVIRMDGQPWHCGLVIDKNIMLHTDRGIDCVHQDFNTLEWKHRVIGYYEYATK